MGHSAFNELTCGAKTKYTISQKHICNTLKLSRNHFDKQLWILTVWQISQLPLAFQNENIRIKKLLYGVHWWKYGNHYASCIFANHEMVFLVSRNTSVEFGIVFIKMNTFFFFRWALANITYRKGSCAFIRYGFSLLEMTRSQTAQFMMIASYYRKQSPITSRLPCH